MVDPGELFSLISKGKTEEVLEILKNESVFFDKDTNARIVLLSNRFQRIKRSKDSDTISSEEYNIEFNKINSTILSLIQERTESNPKAPVNVKGKEVHLQTGKIAAYVIPLVLPIAGMFFQEQKNRIVYYEPEIKNDSVIQFRFMQINAEENSDTFQFHFEILDTTDLSIINNPPIRGFRPDFLRDKQRSRAILTSDDINETKKDVNRQFFLKGVSSFKWEVRVARSSGEKIKTEDFFYELCPKNRYKAASTDCALQISKWDYLSIWPALWFGPVVPFWLLLFFITKKPRP